MYNDHPNGPDYRPLSRKEILITAGCIFGGLAVIFLGIIFVLWLFT